MAKEERDTIVMIAVLTEQLAVDLLMEALPEAMHLRPLWERLVIANVDGYTAIGLPIANKVTKDTIENHRRHFFSLLNLLEVPLAASPKHLHQLEITREQLVDVQWPDPKAKKKEEKKDAS